MNFEGLKFLDKHLDFISSKSDGNFFAVGGCIRDILLGINLSPSDIDLTTNLGPEILRTKLQTNKSTFRSAKFGTVTLLDDKISYEITPLREEGNYLDFRHPGEINWTTSILKDSIRRDFTINCIYYFKANISKIFDTKNKISYETFESNISKYLDKDIYISKFNLLILSQIDTLDTLDKGFLENKIILPEQVVVVGEQKNNDFVRILVNPQSGLQDLQKQTLKCVGNPDARFGEDALRIIRAVRLVNKLNQFLPTHIDFDTSTWHSMKKNFYLVRFLAKERLKDELAKIFSLNKPFEAIVVLNELHLLQTLFPSLERCKNIPQPIRYHALDTYHHSIMTLYHLQDLNQNYLVKLAMLLHDVGKPDQYYYAGLRLSDEERNKLHSTYISHPVIGKDLALSDLKNLGFSNGELEEIGFYIQYHMLPLEGSESGIKNKIKKYIGVWGYERWENLLDIIKADRQGQYNVIQKDSISQIDQVKLWSKEIFDLQGAFSKKDLVVDGNWIMKKFSLQPGKQIGQLLSKTFDWVVVDITRNDEKQIFDFLKQNI